MGGGPGSRKVTPDTAIDGGGLISRLCQRRQVVVFVPPHKQSMTTFPQTASSRVLAAHVSLLMSTDFSLALDDEGCVAESKSPAQSWGLARLEIPETAKGKVGPILG